jgi:hypothetical protein
MHTTGKHHFIANKKISWTYKNLWYSFKYLARWRWMYFFFMATWIVSKLQCIYKHFNASIIIWYGWVKARRSVFYWLFTDAEKNTKLSCKSLPLLFQHFLGLGLLLPPSVFHKTVAHMKTAGHNNECYNEWMVEGEFTRIWRFWSLDMKSLQITEMFDILMVAQ